MTEKKKRNIIIGSLCAVVLLMAVGYAAFQTVLNINGTSNISSNFNVKITGVTSKNVVGTATNNGNPTFTDTSATFKTNLVSPGDSLEYEITVTNAGNLNAKLDKITLSDTNNPAIKFTSSGLTEGDIITAGSTATLTVKVEYLSSVTSDPSSKTSSLTVTLDYSQATSTTPSGESAADTLIKTVVTSGDGLYVDTYEEGRYVYKGANPSNYITYNNEEWRIMAVEADGTLKIIKQDGIGDAPWDDTDSNNWSRPSSLNTYLNQDYYNTLSNSNQELIQSHDFSIGSVIDNNANLAIQITNEKSTIWNGKVGLMTLSDYIRANTNETQCGNIALNNPNYKTCNLTNYINVSSYPWTISSIDSSLNLVFYISAVGYIINYGNAGAIVNGTNDGVLPVLYLKSDITLSGEGTSLNPYIIK